MMVSPVCTICGTPLRITSVGHLCGSSACVRAWRLSIPLEQAKREIDELRTEGALARLERSGK